VHNLALVKVDFAPLHLALEDADFAYGFIVKLLEDFGSHLEQLLLR